MTLYQFNLLNINQQMVEVNDHGLFLDNYFSDLEKCNLYAVHMFFVEVEYNSEKNSIVAIRSFKTGRLLDKYTLNRNL